MKNAHVRPLVNASEGPSFTSIETEDGRKSKNNGLSHWIVAFNTTTAMVGCGVFALGMQAKKTGLIAANVINVFSAFAMYEGGVQFSTAMIAWNENRSREEPPIENMESFGLAAFGEKARIICSATNVTFYLGCCSAYVILTGEVLASLIGEQENGRWYRCLAMPVLIILCMFKNLKALEKVSVIGLLTSALSCFAIVVQAGDDVFRWKSWSEVDEEQIITWAPYSVIKTGSAVAFMAGSYGALGIAEGNAKDMTVKEKFPVAVGISCLFCCIFYSLIITLTYLAYGNFLVDVFVVNMQRYPSGFDMIRNLLEDPSSSMKNASNWPENPECVLYFTASASIIINLVVSYPLVMMTVIGSIEQFSTVQVHAPPGNCNNYLIRLGLIGITFFFGMTLRDLDAALTLFSAICVPCITVIFPIVFSWRIRNKLNMEHPCKLRCLWHVLLLLYALFLGVAGFVDFVAVLGASE